MNKKTKIIGIITNVLVIVILVFVALITLSILISQGKGYTAILGSTYVSVQSDSMEGNYDGSFPYSVKGFNEGDLIKVRILSDEDKSKLEVGDVITFYQDIDGDGQDELNTHRIIEKAANGLSYTTQGDKAAAMGLDTSEKVYSVDIIGKYNGTRISGLGKVVDFFHSPAGFFVCVVLPSLLIVAYFAVNLILTIKSAKALDRKEAYVDEKEKMRQELMKELREAGKIKEETSSPADTPAEEKPEEEAK